MKNFARENFGKQLKLLLRESPLNQKELSERLSVSGSAVSQIINGKMLPSKECFNKLLKLFPESSKKEKLLQIWNFLRTGNYVIIPEVDSHIPKYVEVREREAGLFLISGRLLKESFTAGMTLKKFAIDHDCPVTDTIPNPLPDAKAAVYIRSEELGLPVPGSVLLMLADKRPSSFCKFDLIKTAQGFILNPGSAEVPADKKEWSLPILEIRLIPVKND